MEISRNAKGRNMKGISFLFPAILTERNYEISLAKKTSGESCSKTSWTHSKTPRRRRRRRICSNILSQVLLSFCLSRASVPFSFVRLEVMGIIKRFFCGKRKPADRKKESGFFFHFQIWGKRREASLIFNAFPFNYKGKKRVLQKLLLR